MNVKNIRSVSFKPGYLTGTTETNLTNLVGDVLTANGYPLSFGCCNITIPLNGQVLVWSATSKKYVPTTVQGVVPISTNLGYTPSPINGTITNDNGNTSIIPLANNVNAGLLSPASKAKLDALPTNFIANSSPSSWYIIGGNISAFYIQVKSSNFTVIAEYDPNNVVLYIKTTNGLVCDIEKLIITPTANNTYDNLGSLTIKIQGNLVVPIPINPITDRSINYPKPRILNITTEDSSSNVPYNWDIAQTISQTWYEGTTVGGVAYLKINNLSDFNNYSVYLDF